MTNLVNKAKSFIKDNSTKLSLGAAGIATLGCIYYAGKAAGETTLVMNVCAEHPEEFVENNILI